MSTAQEPDGGRGDPATDAGTAAATDAGPTDRDGTDRDGRSTRWDGHRAQRREELVDATLRAIRRHGATVGMDDVAATAGTSKTVVYRHFTDRAGLYAAVAERVDALILRDLATAVGQVGGELSARDGRGVIAAAIDAYLQLVEKDPEVYRFIVAAPLLERSEFHDADFHDAELHDTDDPGGVPSHVAARMADLIGAALASTGRDAAVAPVWGAALVGMVRATADDWLRPGGATHGRSRLALRDDLTDLVWLGLSGIWPASAPST